MRVCFAFNFVLAMTLNRAFCDREFIEYPFFWTKSRTLFGFPPHFRALFIYYLDEWDSFKKEWLYRWDLVEGANYEVPEYLKNDTYFVPSFRKHCTPGKIFDSDATMLHDFTEEDRGKSPGIRKHVSKINSYWFGDWLNLFMYLYNICYCLRGQKTERTCPNACWKPKICEGDAHSQHICRPVFDKKGAASMHMSHKTRLEHIYSLGYECLCRSGYYFNKESKKCQRIDSNCEEEKHGKSPCRNNGICKALKMEERILKTVGYECTCPLAWRGYLCEKPRNPCRYDDLCGPFPCIRDPNNELAGYACRCTQGYKPKSESDPTCVNVNECEDPINTPCLNGGDCHDLVPPTFVDVSGKERRFRCECRFGFTGTYCEIPPPPVAWSAWGDWSACSVECGMGVRNRHRTCPRPGECLGKDTQATVCAGRVLTCDDVETKIIDGKVTFIYRSETRMLKQAGILWTPEDESLLVDAFGWSEQQQEVKYQGKDHGVRNESIALWLGDVVKLLGLQHVSKYWTHQQITAVLSLLATVTIVMPVFVFLLLKLLEVMRR